MVQQTVVDETRRPPAIVVVEGVVKRFGRFTALNDINLSVRAGEKIVLCGPSGSGKSTLIRCINHIETHDAGRIVVDGVELTDRLGDINNVRREVGMVFQSFNLFPHLSIVENCMLAPMKVRGLSRAEAHARALGFLRKVRIHDQADKYPGQLSGGQQQRVAIARALCMQPKIMLFDEPTSALDPEMVKEVLDIMVEARAGRHDHGLRHARDGLCPRSRRPRGVHGPRGDRRGSRSRNFLPCAEHGAGAGFPRPDHSLIGAAFIVTMSFCRCFARRVKATSSQPGSAIIDDRRAQ